MAYVRPRRDLCVTSACLFPACLQLLALGNCLDRDACLSSSTCGTWGGLNKNADQAYKSPYFSSATAVFEAGTHVALIRVQNPNGCIWGRAGCWTGGTLSYKVVTCESCHVAHALPTHCASAACACPTAVPDPAIPNLSPALINSVTPSS